MQMMRLKMINSADDISALVQDIGFLPFFKNEIRGFSIEECTPPELWFSADTDGPWEWKGAIARSGTCVYGKLFRGKAGFVSMEHFRDFANYRRDGYDYEGFYEDGHSLRKDKDVYDLISESGSILSKSIKQKLNYRKDGNKGFDTVITRLQMQTFVCISDFEYMRDKYGNEYGWGVARYSTPENMFGDDFMTETYETEPEVSKRKIYDHLTKLLPDASEKQILKLIG